MEKKINILLTNDDGIFYEGIIALYQALIKEENFNVFVLAPEFEQSGTSHRITLAKPLQLKEVDKYGIKGKSVNGSPADCIKLALHNIHKDEIDIVVSGINKGSNNGISVHYSGTVAAIVEAGFFKVAGIAISLYDFEDKKYEAAAEFLKDFLLTYGEDIIARKSLLNINIPNEVDYQKLPQFCKLGLGNYCGEYDFFRHLGRNFYWTSGPVKDIAKGRNDDDNYILQNEITITPLTIDLTDLEELKYWQNLNLN